MAWGCRHAAKSFPRCIMDSGLGIRVRVLVGKMGVKLGQIGAAKRGDKNGDLQYVFYEILWFNRFIMFVFQHFVAFRVFSMEPYPHSNGFHGFGWYQVFFVSVPLPNTKSLPNFVHIPSFFFAYFMLLLKGSLNSLQLHLRTGQTSMDVAQLNRHIFQGNVLSLEPKLGNSTPRATTTFPVHWWYRSTWL